MQAIKRFFSQTVISGKSLLGPFDLTEFVFHRVLYTFLSLVFYCLIASHYTGTADLSRWVIGNSIVLCVNTCIFRLGGVFDNDRYFGRLRFIFASPTNLLITVIEKGIVSIMIAFATVVVTFLIGGLVFGMNLGSINYYGFIGAILAASFSAAGLGLMLSSFSLLSDSVNMILNIAASITMLFSGANFPVSQFPHVVQLIVKIFPLNRSISAAYLCYGDYNPEVYTRLIIGELLTGICYYLVAVSLLKVMERLAIKHATLELF